MTKAPVCVKAIIRICFSEICYKTLQQQILNIFHDHFDILNQLVPFLQWLYT